MNNIATVLVAGTLSIAVAACGVRDESLGDGQPRYNESGELVEGGGSEETVGEALDVRVLSDVNRIETGGSDIATITALVTDESNNAVSGEPVSFRASGGVLQDIEGATDENGEAKATLKLAQDFRKQNIVVTVAAGSDTGEVLVSADGSELRVSGPASLIQGAEAELKVFLTAGNDEPIANQVVRFESSAGNRLSPAQAVTDADGQVVTTVSGNAGSDTVRVFALEDTVVADHDIAVSTDSLAFEGLDATSEIPVGADHQVQVTWMSQSGPVAGQPLSFSVTAGRIVGSSRVTTNAAGQATVTIRSDSAGKASLTVEDATDGKPSASSEEFEFVATTPAAVTVEATSTRVPALGTSTIKALVRDVNGNPVKGRRIVFSSPDLKGGQLDPASATSGSDGEASVRFTAGANATTEGEIELVAQVEGTTIEARMNLSVVERVLNITLGTANKVAPADADGPVQYWLNFVVQVADGAGTPLDGADVALSIRPLTYTKGFMAPVDDKGREYSESDEDWQHAGYAIWSGSIRCESEDSNGNRVLDAGEDINTDGSLTPQDPASLVATLEEGKATLVGNSLTTDASGSGYFRMIYPASNASWAEVEITARARDLGAEAEDSFRTRLLVPAKELNQSEFTPANGISPYGTAPDCTLDKDDEG